MKKLINLSIKLAVILIWAIIYYLQFERPFIVRTVHNMSPNFLATSLFHGLFWLTWISIPLLIFAVLKGRFFCWNICPLGIIQDFIPSFKVTKYSHNNMYVFFSLLVIAFFGLNILAFFDPLVIFSRAVIALKMRIMDSIIFSVPIAAVIILNVYRKRFWCFKLCPLGALMDWVYKIKNKQVSLSKERRKFLIALGSGVIIGGLLKYINLKPKNLDKKLLRPPGALPEDQFAERCIRCGSCIAVCLTGTLTPAFFESGLEAILTPKLVPQTAECDEYCNKCGEACPTQAVKYLPLNVKRNVKIGTARVDRSKCIAWSLNSLCLICQEFCPYVAIKKVQNDNNIPCPEVIPDLCRGCGLCEKNCPVMPVRAIQVFNTGAGSIVNS